MPDTFNCPHCGRKLAVRDELGRKTKRCSACGLRAEAPDAPGDAAPREAAPVDETTFAAAIQAGRLDEVMQFLAERHHAPGQRKTTGRSRWEAFVMSPAEVADFAQKYHHNFDMYLEEVASPHGRGLCVFLYPRGAERGCLRLVGLALVTIPGPWLHEQGAPSAEGLPMVHSPMDGHPVQLDFIGTVQKDAVRPATRKVKADGISIACRERLYTLGWDRQQIEMMYFGVQTREPNVGTAVQGEALPSAKDEALGAREVALLQRIFACSAGARQVNETMRGVDTVLASPTPTRAFAAEVSDVLAAYRDAHLIEAFNGLDMSCIPLNDNCAKYFRKAEAARPTLTGPDARMITLAFGLAALAEAGRIAAAQALARKVVEKFMEKCRRGAAPDKMDEWHIGHWGQVYYTVAAAIVMKDGAEHYAWALPILDAVVIENHHAEEPLYWRAMAAHRYWRQKPESPNRMRMAQQRLHGVISAANKVPMDPARVETARRLLSAMPTGV